MGAFFHQHNEIQPQNTQKTIKLGDAYQSTTVTIIKGLSLRITCTVAPQLLNTMKQKQGTSGETPDD